MSVTAIALGQLRKLITQERKTLYLLFCVPVLYCVLFGFAYGANVIKYVPTVIYDQDATLSSRTIVQAFYDSEKYQIVGQVLTEEETEQYLYSGEALAAIIIPKGFARDIKLGLGSEIQIKVNANNLMYANSVLGSSQEIIQTLSAGTAERLIESLNQPPSQALKTAVPVKLSFRILHNPTSGYSNFMLAGLGANGLQLAIVLATCTVLAGQKKFSWLGTNPAKVVIGIGLAYWFFALLAYAAYLVVIILGFGVPFRGSLLDLSIIGAAFTFAVTGVGFLYSVIAPTEGESITLPLLYIMPAFLFSGYSWPGFAMNGFSSFFSATLPLTYAADTIRDIMLAGYAPALYKNTGILLLFGIATTALAAFVLVISYKKAHSARNIAEKGATLP